MYINERVSENVSVPLSLEATAMGVVAAPQKEPSSRLEDQFWCKVEDRQEVLPSGHLLNQMEKFAIV